jgi:hypothetical protein
MNDFIIKEVSYHRIIRVEIRENKLSNTRLGKLKKRMDWFSMW